MLRCIQRSETDPYYNLAAEEYLLKTAKVNTFMTWRNEPSVIVGKHQNTSREINHAFIESHNLPVVRRITGGGAVYHDPGNINYSFIYTDRKENLVDFRYFTEPVIHFLKDIGLNAAFEGKSNIRVDGLKISGNSAHIYRQKVLHHGTLLFNTDLNMLEKALTGEEEHYHDKSVRSEKANVTNINDLLKEILTVEQFISLFRDFIFNYFPGAINSGLIDEEVTAIRILAEEKYRTSRWNYGYSPDYLFYNKWFGQEVEYSINMSVKEGMIIQLEITGSENHSAIIEGIKEALTGTLHEKKSISEKLKKLTFANESEEQVLNQFIQHLF